MTDDNKLKKKKKKDHAVFLIIYVLPCLERWKQIII